MITSMKEEPLRLAIVEDNTMLIENLRVLLGGLNAARQGVFAGFLPRPLVVCPRIDHKFDFVALG